MSMEQVLETLSRFFKALELSECLVKRIRNIPSDSGGAISIVLIENQSETTSGLSNFFSLGSTR